MTEGQTKYLVLNSPGQKISSAQAAVFLNAVLNGIETDRSRSIEMHLNIPATVNPLDPKETIRDFIVTPGKLDTLDARTIACIKAVRRTLGEENPQMQAFYAELEAAEKSGRTGDFLRKWQGQFSREAARLGGVDGVFAEQVSTQLNPGQATTPSTAVSAEEISQNARLDRSGLIISVGDMTPEQQQFTRRYMESLTSLYFRDPQVRQRVELNTSDPAHPFILIQHGLPPVEPSDLREAMRKFPPEEFRKTDEKINQGLNQPRPVASQDSGVSGQLEQVIAAIRQEAGIPDGLEYGSDFRAPAGLGASAGRGGRGGKS